MTLRSIGSIFCSILIVAALSGTAMAGGFAVARFDGEHGNPMTDDASAIYYNPAGMAFGSGYRILVDGVLAWRTAEYTRYAEAIDPIPLGSNNPPSELSIAANTGEATLSNVVVSPTIAFVTDFGTGAPFGVGVGFYTPFGGRSSWDTVDPVEGAIGAVDGSQRWYIMEGTSQTSYISLGVAYEIEAIGLGIGVTGNVLLSELSSIRARDADGSDNIVDENGVLKEGRSLLQVDSTDFSMGFGLLWEALENALWIGVSYQSAVNFDGNMTMEGTLQNAFSIAVPTNEPVYASQNLPDIVRWGVRWRPNVDLELRLSGDWQNWSRFEQMCIRSTAAEGDINTACETNSDGSLVGDYSVIQVLGRHWEDTYSFRVGASYWLPNDIELMASVSYDSNAIPDDYLEPALQDYDKVAAGIGAAFQLTDWFNLMANVVNVFYFERDNRGAATADTLLSPSRQPSSEGVYTQNILVFNLSLNFTFGGGDSYNNYRRGEPTDDMSEMIEDTIIEDSTDETIEISE